MSRRSSLSAIERISELPIRLASNQFFKGLSEKTLQSIVPQLHLRQYRYGDLIIRQGQKGRALFFILSGTATVTSETYESVLSVMHPGAIFGEIGVLYNIERTATVRASSSICKVAVLHREDLEELVKEEVLNTMRERARMHLTADEQKEPGTRISLGLTDMAVFDGYSYWEKETLLLFLSDAKTFRLEVAQRIVLKEDTVYMLVKGEAELHGAFGANSAATSGNVLTLAEYDFLTAKSVCVILETKKSIYNNFVEGINVDYSEDNYIEPVQHAYMSRKRHMPGDSTPDRKKVRGAGKVDLSKAPQTTTDTIVEELLTDTLSLDLSGCWMITDKAVEYICSNFTNLEHLSLSDCWNVTEKALLKLESLKKCKSFSGRNLDGITDKVLAVLADSIEELDISYCLNVSDWSCLGHLTNLRVLTAKRCTALDCSANGLPATLQELNISECHLLRDSTFKRMIDGCSEIWKLELKSCERLTSISAISGLLFLTHVVLANCQDLVSDVSLSALFENCHNLKSIDISHCSNVHMLLKTLKAHKNIKKVIFEHCGGLDSQQKTILYNKYC